MVIPVGSQIFNQFLLGQRAGQNQQAQQLAQLQGVLAVRGALQDQAAQQRLAPLQEQLMRARVAAASAPPSPIKVGPDDTLLHPQNFTPLYQGAGKQPKDADAWGEPFKLGDAWVQKHAITGQVKQAVSRPPITNQNVNFPLETEESKAIGKGLGQQYTDLQTAGLNATGQINKYQRMLQLMEGVHTGKLAPTIAEISSLADFVGLKLDKNLGAKQALDALSNEVALTLRNTGEGAGMPGQLSDKDREFLRSMTPGLAKTREGNQLIIESGMKLAQRRQETAKLAREYRQNNKSLDGFTQFMQDYANKNPLFGGGAATAPSGSYPQPNPQAVQMLRGDPGLAAKFNEKFGPGAAERILGGR